MTVSVPHGFKTFCLIVLRGQLGQKLNRKLNQKLNRIVNRELNHVKTVPKCRGQSADLVISMKSSRFGSTSAVYRYMSASFGQNVRNSPETVLEKDYMT